MDLSVGLHSFPIYPAGLLSLLELVCESPVNTQEKLFGIVTTVFLCGMQKLHMLQWVLPCVKFSTATIRNSLYRHPLFSINCQPFGFRG